MTEPARAWIRATSAADAVVAHLGGELDLAGVPSIERVVEALITDLATDFHVGGATVDVADLKFLDSSGVAVLIRLANHLKPIRLVNTNPVVRRVVEVLSLAPHLGLEAD